MIFLLSGSCWITQIYMDSQFSPEPNLQKVAEAYSLDCVDFYASKFPARLDFSPSSIAYIDNCLQIFHIQMAAAAPKPEQMEFFSKMFGSYLGETYRRTYGGEWGISPDGQPSFRSPGGLVCFPWTRVYKRITNGEEDNVLHWFEYLVKNGGSLPESPPPQPSVPPPLPTNTKPPHPPSPPKSKGFFSRFFGG